MSGMESPPSHHAFGVHIPEHENVSDDNILKGRVDDRYQATC
jgi:hypothetical protein